MKTALAQMNSVDDLRVNTERIKILISDAAQNGAELVLFPENSLFFRIKSGSSIVAVKPDSAELLEIAEHCYRAKIKAHLTTAVLENEIVYNASILIDEKAAIQIVYRKIHLFDIELEGQMPVRESDVFRHGPIPTTFKLGDLLFGSSICYDVRFAELYSSYAKKEVDVILVPSAFLVKTGQAHWETLLRARAIESQCYVLAPAQAGVHASTTSLGERRETFGHTMVINPWGQIVASLPSGEGLLFCELNKSEIEKVRNQIPMKNHRRDVF
jgi:deaminated glutathione amidase